ncbi:MAG: hypothetical protein JJ850_10115 [Kordiimonadaceae bacterium]|nr:hypothetical protein [Kordiimonadaceae bacterium]MBO6569488.1 hypothetical protein [Kordiimonadaceae bacterium]MBO6964963.1 hypothetical protein [Kordiimonadaceae bacterium]
MTESVASDTNKNLSNESGKSLRVKEEKELSFKNRVYLLDELTSAKNYRDAIPLLTRMLKEMEAGKATFGKNVLDQGELAEQHATTFCTAVTRMITDPACKWSDTIFLGLIPVKRSMAQAWEVSGYRGTRHLPALVGQKQPNGSRNLSRQDILKLFWALSINALNTELLKLLLKQPAEVAWPLCIAFMSEQIVYTPVGKSARPKIIQAYEHLSKAPPVPQLVRNVGPAYMGCSYDESAGKHDIKHAMNTVIRKWLLNSGVSDIDMSVPRRTDQEQPTVLVLAELYDSRHAMHRCYGPSIASLKPHFKTVLMTTSGQMDEALTDMFDVIDQTKFDANNPAEFVNQAQSYKPDMVYFPSVGMRLMSIACSTVRIAPIQVMTFGHPATTHSNCVDYAVLDAEQIGSPDTVNEKILCRASKPRFALREDATRVSPKLRHNPRIVRIAVPAWSRKISPTFLQTCMDIERACLKEDRPVEFWFFPNAVGTLLQGFARRVKTLMTAKVLPRTNYNNYISTLNQCDIFLSSFPFGATNGIVDAIKQGLPVVNLTGPEVHEANDSHIVKRFEQPEWLTTKSREEYVRAVVRLVTHDKLRVKIGQNLLKNDPDSKLVAKDGARDFATVMRVAMKHHEAFKASDQSIWQYSELEALAADL